MIAFPRPRASGAQTHALSRDLLNGLSAEEFDAEAGALARASRLTEGARERLRTQLTERLKTPVDRPSWGPDWVRHGERVAAQHRREGIAARLLGFARKDAEEKTEEPLSGEERCDAAIIARNMEKSRQVSHYRPLYAAAIAAAAVIALASMFVDYEIIRGDVWTRALADEFMVVPESLHAAVVFKSMQVIFAVLIVHFMLKITGHLGRNALVAAAFVLALVMIGCLGYLVAYNNMTGGTAAALEQPRAAGDDAIDRLFDSSGPARTYRAAMDSGRAAMDAGPDAKGVSLGLPKLSRASLADADSWFWLAFASVIFFIVTTVAALYMQAVENNVRNFHIARDYRHRQKQLAQLHLLERAETS